MLFFDDETTVGILLSLARMERYTPGYWRAAPHAYVRDARVYARLVEERLPRVSARLQDACLVPEAYASKWFIGLCVHVLPFEALISYVEAFLEQGYVFLFKFSVAVVDAISHRLLAPGPADPGAFLEHLRLDRELYPDDHSEGTFFNDLVATARDHVDIECSHIDALREEEWALLEERMRRVQEIEASMRAEFSDDEIVFSDESDDED